MQPCVTWRTTEPAFALLTDASRLFGLALVREPRRAQDRELRRLLQRLELWNFSPPPKAVHAPPYDRSTPASVELIAREVERGLRHAEADARPRRVASC